MPAPARPPSRPGARRLPMLLCGVLGLAAVAVLLARRGEAEAEPLPHMVYVSITGEGPSAKAWYDGAAPTGVPVQAALDTFAKQGYRLGQVSEARAREEGESLVWLLILERGRR